MAQKKDPMAVTDMDRAYNAANAMSGYRGPSTAKQQSEMTNKYGTAPEGKELYTITNGRAVYKTKEEIAALDKNIPDYSNPSDRAEINYQQREATRQEITPQQQAESDARFLQTLKPRTSTSSATQEVPSVDITQASSTKAATTAPKSMTAALGGVARTDIKPAFDFEGENAAYLKKHGSEFGSDSGIPTPSGTSGNPMMGLLNSGSDISDGDQSTAFSDFNYLSSLKKSTPKQSNTEVVSVNGRDVPVHKAETMDYRPERDGVMLGVTTTSGQEPTIFGKTLGQMSPEERGLWTKKPEGIDFDEGGMLFGTAQKRSPEEEARIAKWEESELQNNPEVRGRRIKTYEEQLKGATTNDPEELRSKGYNPEGVAAAKKELERLRGMGKNTNAATKPKTQLPNPYQDRVDGLLAFGDNPADWGF
jgi:hypothetical protein